MEPTEPMMAPPAHTPNTAWNTPAYTANVRFAVRPKRGQRGITRLSTQHKGLISVDGEEVALIKSSRKLLQKPVVTKLTFARSQIFDARAEGSSVYFDVHAPDGIHQVLLTAPKRAVARKILECLPSQISPAQEAEQTALASHSKQVQALTPTTWVTYGLIAINLLVYLAMCAAGVGIMAQNAAMTVDWGTNFGPLTLRGEWWRLITSVFVHFGLFHLALNMFALYQIGRLAERLYGNWRFLMLYLFAGVTGSLASVLWHPANNSAGASGAVFGVFGALLVFVLKYRRELPPSFAQQQRTSILILIGYNLFYGFTQQGIDNGAHLGGLAGGVLLGLTLARSLNEPVRSNTALRGIVLSGVLALGVLGAAFYLLAAIREALG